MQNYTFASNSVPVKHIEYIIFDLGGVIINLDMPATLHAFQQLAKKYGREDFVVNFSHPLFTSFEIGAISPEEFRHALRSFIHPAVLDEEIDSAWNAMLLDIPSERLVMLQHFKNHYQTYLLSNTNTIHFQAFHKILCDTHGYDSIDVFFHRSYFSHQIGKRKPEAEAFKHVLDKNGLSATHTLLIDDTPANIETARSLGMQTQLVTPANSLKNIFLALFN